MSRGRSHKSSRVALTALAALAAMVATSLGCGADFDPGSRVTDLRVLAVRADQTYAHPGEDVHLDALWFDPQRDTRARQWAWTYCTDPESSTILGCLQALARESARTHKPPSLVIGSDIDVFKLTVPGDAIDRLPAPAQRNALIGVVTIVCPGTIKVAPDFSQLGPDDLPIQCVSADSGAPLPIEQWVIGLKRIFVRKSDRNANPVIARVTWDGADWGEKDVKQVASACDTDGNRYDRCPDAEHHDVALVLTDGSYESGVDELRQPFHEQVVVQYYATEGLFEHDVKVAKDPPSAWTARTQSKGKLVTMWMVGRDNRGGVTWAERKVQVK